MNSKKLLSVLLLLTNLLIFSPQVAAFDYGDRSATLPQVKVSARIDDTIPPTTPILVSPVNGSYLGNPKVTFCFKKSTDAGSPVWYYQLFVNGQVWVEEIPASQSPKETEKFSLLATEDSICLTYKKPLDDGQYTWKIRVYDSYKNYADSATWTFTIDTQAPFIIITRVGENENLALSTTDPASIPQDLTLQTFQTKPEFEGKSEPASLVQISLLLTKDNKIYLLPIAQVFSTANFSIAPVQDLPHGLYKVTVSSSDPAGNTAVLPQFYLLITAKKPPIIPLPPLIEKPEVLLQVPAFLVELPPWQKTFPFLTLLLLIIALALLKIGLGVPFYLLPLLIFFLIFLRKKKKSLTYDAESKKYLSFVTLKVFKIVEEKTDNLAEEVRSFLSDIQGRFELKLSQGVYKIKALRPGFIFPSQVVTGQEDGQCQNVYHGERLLLKNEQLYIFLNTKYQILNTNLLFIPLDPDKSCNIKYKRIIFCAKLICLLALLSSLTTIVFLPNLLTLLLFLFCGWLQIRSWQIH